MDKLRVIRYARDNHRCLALLICDRLFGCLDTSVSRKCKLLLGSDPLAYLKLDVDPSTYSNPDLFKRDWLAVNLFAKYPYLDTGLNKAQSALDKFMASEITCRQSNSRLSEFAPIADPKLDSLIESSRFKIARVLQDFDVMECIDEAGFSSGASTSKRRTQGDPLFKFRSVIDVTKPLYPLACEIVKSSPSWSAAMSATYGLDCSKWFRIVEGNEITTVPKNAKSDRIIAIEPDMNMFVQKGIGNMIRKRLKKVNVNLNDQSRNQRLAAIGSIDGSLATLDLSSASDTICRTLVRRLLPPDWFAACSITRSPVGKIRASGVRVRYEKISSMGNGYTFELESLIFWALAQSVHDSVRGDGEISVYGDDLIVPVAEVTLLRELLSHCGFSVNEEKSFSSGPFRESCGKHYFQGIDVTPFYVRERVATTHRTYWLANKVREWACYDKMSLCDARYHPIWVEIVNSIPSRYKIFGPVHLGDNVIHATFSEALPRVKYSSYFRRRVFLSLVGKRKRTDSVGLLPKILHLTGKRSYSGPQGDSRLIDPSIGTPTSGFIDHRDNPCDDIIVRKDQVHHCFATVEFLQWVDPGHWAL